LAGEVPVLLRASEPRGEGDPGAECLTLLLGERSQQRGVEEPWRDRVDADSTSGHVPSGRQGQPDDAALGGGVGDLADLAVPGGDARRVDADAALALLVGLVV